MEEESVAVDGQQGQQPRRAQQQQGCEGGPQARAGEGAGREWRQEASRTAAHPLPRRPHPILTQGLSSQSPAAGQHKRPGLPGCTGRHSSSSGGESGRGFVRGWTASTPEGPAASAAPNRDPEDALGLLSPSPFSNTYRDSKGHRASETPDECIIDGEPAEVGVPIALGVQAHSETWEHDSSRGRGGQGLGIGRSGGLMGPGREDDSFCPPLVHAILLMRATYARMEDAAPGRCPQGPG